MLKQEILQLKRDEKREGVDMLYLKNVVLKYIETDESERLMPVLAMLLQFR